MSKEKIVTVNFVFKEHKDEFDDEGDTWFDLDRMDLVGSGLTDEEVDGWAEGFLQSDYAFIDFPRNVVEAMEGKSDH